MAKLWIISPDSLVSVSATFDDFDRTCEGAETDLACRRVASLRDRERQGPPEDGPLTIQDRDAPVLDVDLMHRVHEGRHLLLVEVVAAEAVPAIPWVLWVRVDRVLLVHERLERPGL